MGEDEGEAMGRCGAGILLGVASAMLVVSCGGGDDTGAADGGSPEASSPAAAVASSGAPTSDQRLPEGTYQARPVTTEDLLRTGVAAGFAQATVEAYLGVGTAPSATFEWTLRLDSGRWVQFESVAGGPDEIGWSGTYEVVDDDTVIATDPCGAITYDYAFDGTALTLRMVDDQCQAVGEDTAENERIAQTIIYGTAPFTKVA